MGSLTRPEKSSILNKLNYFTTHTLLLHTRLVTKILVFRLKYRYSYTGLSRVYTRIVLDRVTEAGC